MERLTHRETPENKAYVDRGLVHLSWYSMDDDGWCGEAIERLATIEDILGDTYDLDHLRGLAQAERDGRLVVLLCKVGDTVYFPVEGRWDSATIEHIEVWPSGVRFFWVQYDIGPETSELWDDGDFEMEDIGKTVFLTRQGAEAAVEKMKGDQGNELE